MSVKELKLSAVEINTIFENMPNEILEKIPLGVKDFFKQIASDSYHFEYDKSKRLDEQILMPKTKGILALLYRDYISSETERKEFISYYNSFLEEKQKSQNMPNVQKTLDTVQTNTKQSSDTMIVTITKDKWYQKLFNIIKNIFSKN